MTEKQRLDKIAELKSEMRSMIEVAGTEKKRPECRRASHV